MATEYWQTGRSLGHGDIKECQPALKRLHYGYDCMVVHSVIVDTISEFSRATDAPKSFANINAQAPDDPAEPGESNLALVLRLWLLLRSFHHRLHILARRDIRHIWHVRDLTALGVGHDDSDVIQ